MRHFTFLTTLLLLTAPLLASASIYFPDSTNDFHDSNFNPSVGGALSIAGWFRPSVLSTGGANDQDLFFQCTNNACDTNGFKLNQVDGSGASRAQINFTVTNKALGTAADVLAAGTWFYIAASYSSSTQMTLCWGAITSSSLSCTSSNTGLPASLGSPATTLRVGNFVNAVQGNMAFWRIWNSTLTQQQLINEEWRSTCINDSANPLSGCWQMNQGELDANTDVFMTGNASTTPGWRVLNRTGSTAGMSSINPPVSMAE